MKIVCLDMEGVLTPEIWIAFADEIGIPELRRTTRDEPEYDKLMRCASTCSAAGASSWRRYRTPSPASTRCPARRSFWMSFAARPRC